MIRSTTRDLRDHRQGVLDASLRQSMFPLMMEHLPTVEADNIQAPLDRVNEAQVSLGIFAYGYGYVPRG